MRHFLCIFGLHDGTFACHRSKEETAVAGASVGTVFVASGLRNLLFYRDCPGADVLLM